MNLKKIITDIVVVGSGAGGLAAAVTAVHHGAKVIVIEKSDKYGGTSAMSGGGIWIPNSNNARKLGKDDSFDEALTYMQAAIGGEVSIKKMTAFLQSAPAMLDFLQQHSHMQYEAFPYPDYYSNLPGAKTGFRTQSPKVFNGAKLGDDLYNIQKQPMGSKAQGLYTLTFKEARKFLTQEKGWRLTLLKVVLIYYFDIVGRCKHKMSRRLTQGHSLIGSLYLSLKQKGGKLWLKSPMKRLLTDVTSRVIGVIIDAEGEEVEIIAQRGVILAAGGFEHNHEMREQRLPEPTNVHWSVSQENNTGDAINAAMQLNAKVELMQHAWWIPVVYVPGRSRPQGLFVERSLPGLIIVNQQGERFVNEALPYLESGYALYEEKAIPAWLVFDAKFRHKYPMGPLGPGWAMPDKNVSKKVMNIVSKAETIEQLAEKIKVDANGLKQTISRNNRFSETGIDEDLQRGDSFYERYYGDASNKPNPCIAAIDKAPYYAIPIYPGDIGTKGGLATNCEAQVLDEDNQVIEGLYAIGNCSASVMGSKYLGAGATLGPAMIFGYRAVQHALGIDK